MSESAAADASPPAPPQPSRPTLAVPAPVAAVESTQAAVMAPQVDPARLPRLENRVERLLTTWLSAGSRPATLPRHVDTVAALGDADLCRAAETSDRLLDTLVPIPTTGRPAEASSLGNLLELRRTVAELDPSQAAGTRKFLGLIPYGNKVADYFRTYDAAQDHLNAILHRLHEGQDALTGANVALNEEKRSLWSVMGRLNAYLYLAEQLQARLAAKTAELGPIEPDRATALRRDVLRALRRKHHDLLARLAVSVQTYLVADAVIGINRKLIEGVDWVVTTTLTARRMASTLAGTPPSSTVGLPQLQAAFADVTAAVDAVDSFMSAARDSMTSTLTALRSEVDRARAGAHPTDPVDAERGGSRR